MTWTTTWTILVTALLAACGTADPKPTNQPPAFAGVTELSVQGDELIVRWNAATDDATASDAIKYRLIVVPRYAQRLLAAGWTPPELMAHAVDVTTNPGVTEQRVPMPTGPGWTDGACCVVRVRAIDSAHATDSNVVIRALADPALATRDPDRCQATLASLAQLQVEGRAALAAQFDAGVADASAEVLEMFKLRESIGNYQTARSATQTRAEKVDHARTALRATLDKIPGLGEPAAGVAFLRGAAAVWSPDYHDLLFCEATGAQLALSARNTAPNAELDARVKAYNRATDPVDPRADAWREVDLLASSARRLATRKRSYQYLLTVQDYFARTSVLAQRVYDTCDDATERHRERAGAHLTFIDESLATFAARLDESIRTR